MKPLLAVDGDSFAHRAYHALPKTAFRRADALHLRGDQRRELKWALDQLLFRKQTSREAVRLLWLIAEAERGHAVLVAG